MIAIIDYQAGNIRSVENALKRLNYSYFVSDDPEAIQGADKVIFPGVGAAPSAMKHLSERKLDLLIPQLKQPVLGICLGMQLMCRYSEEGNTLGLKIFDLEVKQFPAKAKVPHMGWNSLKNLKGCLFLGIPAQADVYFVHSYYVEPGAYSIAETDYILRFSAALQKDNFYACQFHPEKSGGLGERILQNFLAL